MAWMTLPLLVGAESSFLFLQRLACLSAVYLSRVSNFVVYNDLFIGLLLYALF